MELTTEDRLTIHELLARLDHAVDAQDWDTYLSVFHPEAAMDPGFADPVEGTEAIRGFLEATEAMTSGKRHVASNVFIDATSGGAIATSYLTVIEREDAPRVTATAVIRDTLVRSDTDWLVLNDEVRVDPCMYKTQPEQLQN